MAGLTKLARPKESVRSMRQYGLESKAIASFAGLALPIVEIMVAIFLLIPITSAVAAVAATMLFGVFLTMTIFNLLRQNKVPCGCFGQYSRNPISWLTAVRTGFFLASSIAAIVVPQALASNAAGMSMASMAIVVGVLLAILGAGLTLRDAMGTAKIDTTPTSNAHTSGRREFLKGLGATLVGILLAMGLGSERVKAIGAHCQYLDHYEPGCCALAPERKTKHHFKRCCNTQTGQVGYWHKYAPDACVVSCCCECSCDVYHSCSGGSCYCQECCSPCPQ